jgi:nitrate reductase molybdenum cofactor assembly chaperone NarJ/NarW
MTGPLAAVVEAFCYPGPDAATRIGQAVEGLAHGQVRSELTAFLTEVSAWSLGHWEETHTRTLDLSPLFVPYVGHITWGESYRRGAFMAELQRAQLDAGVDQHGELPDHILPILEYLDRVAKPMTDLVNALPDALATMRKDLRKAEPENPYLHVLAAAAAAVEFRLSQGAAV